MPRSSRQTFLFADLAGFAALTAAHGDERAADAAEAFFGCVRALLAGHEAEEVKTIGDAVMVRASSAEPAVGMGLDIVDAVDSTGDLPAVRVGLDTGHGVERGGDWFGSAVNTAARVTALAGGHEVLLTEATRKSAGPMPGISLQRRGEMRLKNLPEPVLIHRAARVGAGPDQMAVDPVCRMTIAEGSAAGRLSHRGVDYEFCSLVCAEMFARDPERYAGGG